MSEQTEKPREFLVITSKGYWGKGHTPEEAAKAANVKGTFVRGAVYYADPSLVKGEIACTGMGGTEWMWTEKAANLVDDDKYPFLHNLFIQRGLKLCSGELKVTKGQLICQLVVADAVR